MSSSTVMRWECVAGCGSGWQATSAYLCRKTEIKASKMSCEKPKCKKAGCKMKKGKLYVDFAN